MSDTTVTVEVRDGVARLTLNRPQARNAVDLALARDLLEGALACGRDPSARAVLVTGAGPVFSVGGDLRAFAAAGECAPALFTEITAFLHAAVTRLARLDAPVVAAVNGAAAGAGMSLAAAADLVIAAESARFTMAYTAVGLTPDGSSTYFLRRVIGLRRTQELMLTNRTLSAAEALDWGLVTRVVPDAELAAESEKLAAALAAGPTRAFGGVKKLLLASAANGLETQMELEGMTLSETGGTADAREGISAFLEKRKASFAGR